MLSTIGWCLWQFVASPVLQVAKKRVAHAEYEAGEGAAREQLRPPVAWAPLNPAEGGFNVLMPAGARETSRRRQTWGGQEAFDSREYSVEVENYLLSIEGITISHARAAERASHVLTKPLDQIARGERAHLVENLIFLADRQTTVLGYPCREYEMQGIFEGQTTTVVGRLILTPDRGVAMSVEYIGSERPVAALDRFMSSLVIGPDSHIEAALPFPNGSTELNDYWQRTATSRTVQRRELDRSEWLTVEHSSVSVLPHIDPLRHGFEGNWWRFEDGVMTPASQACGLALPVRPPGAYELTINVQRVSGKDSFAIGLSVGGWPAIVVIDGYGGSHSGLSMINGQTTDVRSDGKRGRFLKRGPNRIVVRVHPDQIQATCNNNPIVDWKGDPSTLGVNSRYWNPPPDCLFLGAWESEFLITGVEIRAL